MAITYPSSPRRRTDFVSVCEQVIMFPFLILQEAYISPREVRVYTRFVIDSWSSRDREKWKTGSLPAKAKLAWRNAKPGGKLAFQTTGFFAAIVLSEIPVLWYLGYL